MNWLDYIEILKGHILKICLFFSIVLIALALVRVFCCYLPSEFSFVGIFGD